MVNSLIVINISLSLTKITWNFSKKLEKWLRIHKEIWFPLMTSLVRHARAQP